MRQIPKLIDHEHIRVDEGLDPTLEPPLHRGVRESPNQCIGTDKARAR